ncbi:MAG: GNAT family N-acetyltransferase [Hyphomicrobiales bacterium]|nr:GNAT family N-acetyltransferase [Hyphomicrobiales bacterium]MBV9977579.1 GNAT family N-acetyltransferase [Hyphomicrobiales bacterium]
MLIRPLRSSDQQAASHLLRQLDYNVDVAELASRIDRVLASSTHFAVAAEESGRIYGLAHAYERPALEKALEVVLQSLVVDQSVRKKGVGKQLVRAAETWAISRGIDRVVLHTRIDREDARRFYERIGYKVTATSHLMTKCLA